MLSKMKNRTKLASCLQDKNMNLIKNKNMNPIKNKAQ